MFGIKKKSALNRTLQPARSQVNIIRAMKREYSRKSDEIIPIIEACSQGPRTICERGQGRMGYVCGGGGIRLQRVMSRHGIHILIIR